MGKVIVGGRVIQDTDRELRYSGAPHTAYPTVTEHAATSGRPEVRTQQDAIDLINSLGATPDWNAVRGVKDQLVGIDAMTRDPEDTRNMYQILINQMLGNQRGAPLLSGETASMLRSDKWRRTGPTTYTDPSNPDFLRDLKGLASFENPGVFHIEDLPGGGIAQINPFQEGWAQGDEDKGEGLGITDWGNFAKLLSPMPLKLWEMSRNAAQKAKESALDVGSNLMDSPMVENISDTLKYRKKGRGWKGAIEDTFIMLGIGNTKKTNEFIKSQADTNNEGITRSADTEGEIETDLTKIENIKSDKKEVIKLHELTDLKNKRNELYDLILSGQGYDTIFKDYEDLQAQIWKLDQGKLQNKKEGGIATLATGGFLEEQHRQPTNPLLQPTNMGGGFGNQFEDITNKLTSMEEGIATLNNRIASPQQGQSPWMLGRYG